MTFDYDLFVIGGGSGGVRAARTSAATGAKVGLAEESRMGGTCVIRGCVPKKLMVFASEAPAHAALARDYGWSASAGDFDWGVFQGKLHSELNRLEGVYRRILDNNAVEMFDARASLTDAHTVALSDGRSVTAKTILIATGGRPVKPNIPGAEHAIVSDEIFDLETLPKSILIVGGGFIACEFACILHGLGVKVTQYYRGEQILRGFDDEARGLVSEMMQARGIDLQLGTNVSEMKKAPDGVSVTSTNGDVNNFDHVFFATGRAPNSRGLGLEEIGVEINDRGAIEVDKFSKTALDNIYAIGDVTNRIQLTPVAIREGMAFMETVFNDNPTAVDHTDVPSAVFTQPELGTVGLTEEQAREQEPIEVYSTSFRPMKTAFAGHEDKVLMKLVVSQATRKVLGCHIVAPDAGELIQMVGIAVKAGLTKEDFDRTVAVHPTASEELVTMKEPTRTA